MIVETILRTSQSFNVAYLGRDREAWVPKRFNGSHPARFHRWHALSHFFRRQ